MDEELKRRLTGAAIITALAVIFVPMLFEDKSAGPAGGPGEVAPLPKTVEETTLDLPKSAADVVEDKARERKDDGRPARKTRDSGYRIVPMEDAPAKPPKAEPAAARSKAPVPGGEAAVAEAEEFVSDEGDEDAPVDAGQESAPPGHKGGNPAPGRGGKPGIPGKAAPAEDRAADEEAEGFSPAEDAAPRRPAAPRAKSPPVAEKGKPGAAPRPDPAHPATGQHSATGKSAPAPAGTSEPVAKPAAAKPASNAEAAAKPAGRAGGSAAIGTPPTYVVQAGSFAGEANARALADKLRKQNLPANVRVLHKESGDVYRVTVGPELSRARAEQIVKQIEGSVGIKGMILPHR